MKKKFYVTTPIYYPNDIPHIGHAYTTIAADVLARWHKIRGEDVFFLTGTDEHGKKIENAAREKGKKPKEFVDELIPKFKEAWKNLNIEYDKFIRTTDSSHEKIVKEVLQKVFDRGDIYKGEYEGLYCVGCEAYYTEKDAVDGCCPIHKKKLEQLKEETYFFKLSKYQKKLLEVYKKNPGFILPESKRNEIISKVGEGLNDFSISRTGFSWGIPLPFDKRHVCYVWFDALLNYYSATREKGREKFWPADVHLIGKDILWFHTVYWPAMLLSAGIKLPENVFAHGWWTFNQEKISKSRGKLINVAELVSIAGVDSARYFLFRETSFGEDGDFSEEKLVERNNSELADKLGNLVSRVSALAEKHGLAKTKNKLLKKLKLKEIEEKMRSFEFDKALNLIFEFIDACNLYVQENELWKTGDRKKMYELADSIKAISILLYSFIPSSCEKIARQFGFEIGYDNIKKPLKAGKIKKAEILFKKIGQQLSLEKKVGKETSYDKINKPEENKSVDQQLSLVKKVGKENPHDKVNKEEIEGIVKMNEIKFAEWKRMDLRVAQIKKVEDIEGADKLYKLTINVGELGERVIVAGIKKQYKKEQLKNKKIVIIANLEPRVMKGIESKGMLLAASTPGHDKVVLLNVDSDIENGSKVS